MEHGQLFHILHAKLQQKLFNIPISDSRYCTCILGNDSIAMIMCCNIGYSSFTFNYFRKLVCVKHKDVHRTYYYQEDVDVVNVNTINCNTHDNLNK